MLNLHFANTRKDALASACNINLHSVTPTGPTGEFGALEPVGTRLTFARDEEIYSEGDDAKHWHKVVSGTVRTCKLLADGRRHIARFFFAGDFLGIEDVGEHALSAEAITDVVLMRYARAAVERMAEQDPGLARRVREMAFKRIADAHGHMLLLGRKTAAERVASFLLEIADRGDHESQIDLPMPRYDIADYLGLTTETVCRVLSSLRRRGAIAVPNAQRIHLLNRSELEEVGGIH